LRSEWIVVPQSHPFQEEMMRMTKGWTELRTAVIALGLVAWTATGANAAVLKYQTVTSMEHGGVTGANVINFIPTTGSVDLSGGSSNASLGKFVVAPLSAGESTTYDHTSFHITFLPQSLGGVTASTANPLEFSGFLNGKITGDSASTVTATFDKPPTSLLNIGGQSLSLGVPDGALSLVPSSVGSGETTAQTQFLATGVSNGGSAPVPEPSTIALFFTTLGGLGLRRFVQSRKRQASL
jgi:hypothetical protein